MGKPVRNALITIGAISVFGTGFFYAGPVRSKLIKLADYRETAQINISNPFISEGERGYWKGYSDRLEEITPRDIFTNPNMEIPRPFSDISDLEGKL